MLTFCTAQNRSERQARDNATTRGFEVGKLHDSGIVQFFEQTPESV
jgi:hypothetical protein